MTPQKQANDAMATNPNSRKRAAAEPATSRDDLDQYDELTRMIARLIGLNAVVENAVEGMIGLELENAVGRAHAHSRVFHNHHTTRLPAASLKPVHCRVPAIATSAPGRGALASRSERLRAGGTDQADAHHRSGLLGSSQRRRNRI